MARNKSHGLQAGDVLTYNEYLDRANAEKSPDTAPTLIPVLQDDGTVVMTSYNHELTRGARVLEASQDISKSIATLDIEHWFIHKGRSYFNGTVVEVAANATFDWVIEVGECPTHLIFTIGATEAGITFTTYEDVVANEDGTIQELINHNRLSTRETTTKMRLRPTGVDITGSSIIRTDRLGRAGTTPVRQGGSTERTNEVIFKPNTKYLLRVTNLSNAINYVKLFHTFYENVECQE